MIKNIEQATVIPHEELARNVFGTVVVKFVVDEQAKIIGAAIQEAPSPGMGQAVLQAVAKMRPFTQAGSIDGEPAAVLYLLPIRLGHPKGTDIVWTSRMITYQPKTTFLEAEQ